MELQRHKIIRRIGDSVGIIFNKEEKLLFNIEVGNKVKVTVEKEKGDQ